jgi:predicted nucleotidyltransferase/DNA-binding XRE family transcriptional regulator
MDSEAELLRHARRAAGLSQRDLAQQASTTQAMVARYESGAASPTIATLRRLLAACHVRLDLRTAPMGAVLQGPVGQRVAAHRKEIRRLARHAGARNVRVFGSTARGEDHEGSDLDLLVDFPVRDRGLIPLAELADRIADLLELSVDVAAEDALAPDVAARALAEAVAL